MILEKEKTKTKTEESSPDASKLREVYSFTVEYVEKQKVSETETRKNKDGSEEQVEVTKEVEASVPYRVIIKQPNRKEMEEAELEYSIEMSNCIGREFLPKPCLQKSILILAD